MCAFSPCGARHAPEGGARINADLGESKDGNHAAGEAEKEVSSTR
jgi:hypothetical protein